MHVSVIRPSTLKLYLHSARGPEDDRDVTFASPNSSTAPPSLPTVYDNHPDCMRDAYIAPTSSMIS